MGRGSNRAKGEAKPAASRKSPKSDDAGVRDLEKRLAETLAQLQTREAALAEAREQATAAQARADASQEQQGATAEILRVMRQSPIEIQPVFSAIAESAVRLTGAVVATVYEFDGSLVHLRGWAAPPDYPYMDYFRRQFPRAPAREFAAGWVILERALLHRADLQNDPNTPELTREWARQMDLRSVLWVPMLREGEPIGVIGAVRREAGMFSDDEVRLLQTFADQAVVAIENVRLFTELQAKNRAVSESLEQQTATAEILRLISQSPTGAAPVFEGIARSAARLCRAVMALIALRESDQLDIVASFAEPDIQGDFGWFASYPRPLARAGAFGHVIRERATFEVEDTERDTRLSVAARAAARRGHYRRFLVVPMLCEGEAIGLLTVAGAEPGRFPVAQIALLQTFADQAVIAIENVRLFNELQQKNQAVTKAHAEVSESLEQQTATAEILRVISQSPTDVQPVFDALIESATRLCVADIGAISRLEGDVLRLILHSGMSPAVRAFWDENPPLLARSSVTGRAALERRTMHVPDILADSSYDYASPTRPLRKGQALTGYRAALVTPMLRDGAVIGTIAMLRREARPFTASQIKLLETFADQAVIAIENVRLFTELQQKNEALTQAHAQVSEALERQTATADILRAISMSQAEVQPVFDAIVDNAMRLFRAWAVAIYRLDGKLGHLIAARGGLPGSEQQLPAHWPIDESSPGGRCIAHRTVVHIPDADADPALDPAMQRLARMRGWRSVLAAPIMRDEQPIGAITVTRAEAGSFSSAEVELLQTFAAQAVIAIENARLLTELRARTQQLTRSVEQLTALGEVGQAVSSSLELETVLTTIVSRAVQLSGLEAGAIYEYDETAEVFHLRATQNLPEEFLEIARPLALPRGEGATGQLAVTREPVQIPDIMAPNAYYGRMRDVLLRMGHRALLAVPLISEDHIVGGLVVNRRQPGEFPPEVIELLRTFATQSALAIQNARLFREIEEKSRQLEVASQHKSEFLANMSHELRTPLNAIIGFSEVLSERMFGDLNEKQEEYLKDIYASGTHLLSLINDILDLSKIEAGRMELELTDFHLPTALDSALTLVRERAGRRGIALQLNVDDRLGQIQADERKVRQVVLNLLSNAIKFTPEGGRIDVGAKPVNGSIEVSVTDTGVGIAPEDHAAVFEEFRQVGTAEKKVEGTGLGLALSRKFVELHGGKIWVKSQVGQGSTFMFTIPVRRGE